MVTLKKEVIQSLLSMEQIISFRRRTLSTGALCIRSKQEATKVVSPVNRWILHPKYPFPHREKISWLWSEAFFKQSPNLEKLYMYVLSDKSLNSLQVCANLLSFFCSSH